MSQRSPHNSAATSARSPDPYLLLALLLSLAAAAPLLIGPGIINTRAGGDSPFLLQRTHQLAAMLRGGALPARWMPDAAYGLGYPAPNYYASFPYYVAALLDLAGLGVLWGIKASQAIGFLLAGAGAYALARVLKASRLGSLVASAAYTFAPFHLVNVYVRGDSLSEFYAMALYPLILWSLLRLVHKPSPERAAALAASYALLVLSHNVSALLFSPLLGLWLLVVALRARGQARVQVLLYGSGALALGLALSVWFWGPALAERALVQLGEQTTGYFHFAGHLRSDLIQWRPVHNYAIGGEQDPFRLGLAQAVLALAGIIALIIRRARGERSGASLLLTLGALLVLGWMMTPSSGWLWEHVPLLAYAQFPWRLLSIQALMIALLAAQIPTAMPRTVGLAFGAVCIGLAALSGMLGLEIDRLFLREGDVTAERLMLYETYSGNIGGTVRYEYLPQEMIPRPYTSGVQLNQGAKPEPLTLEGRLLSARPQEIAPTSERWQIEVAEPTLLAFHTSYFAGWEAHVDGEREGVEPLNGLGLIGVRLEAGAHQVDLALKRTAARRYAELASGIAFAILLALALYPCRASRRCRLWALASATGLAAFALWLVIAPKPTQRLSGPDPLIMDYMRAPYLHSEPQGVVWAESVGAKDSVRLTGYELAPHQAQPGEAVGLRAVWSSSLAGAKASWVLKGATAHYSSYSPDWAKVSQQIDSQVTSIEIPLPDDIPPGLYVVECNVRYNDEDLPAFTAAGREMSTVALRPIQVMGHRRASGQETALGLYGPEGQRPTIALIDVASEQTASRRLQVALTWRSERQAPINYELSLRLYDAEGVRLAARDLPPFLGTYPTSLWRPGEILTDRVVLKLPKDTQFTGNESLEIVLYDRVTLQAAGSVQAPVVVE